MSRTTATLLLVVCLLVAGCAGLGGGGEADATTTTDDTPTNAETPTPDDGTTVEPVENLTFTEGTDLSLTALYAAQFEYFNASDGYHVESTITFDEPTPSGFVERYDERRLDLVDNRGYGVTEFVRDDDSRRQQNAYFYNESVLVTLQGPPEEATPQSQSFPSHFYVRAISSYADATAIEYTQPLAFEFDDTTTDDGQTVYRFTADSFAADADQTTIQRIYGDNASVDSATLLVTAEGHITGFQVTFSIGPDGDRRTASAVYDVTVGQPDVQKPDWVDEAA